MRALSSWMFVIYWESAKLTNRKLILYTRCWFDRVPKSFELVLAFAIAIVLLLRQYASGLLFTHMPIERTYFFDFVIWIGVCCFCRRYYYFKTGADAVSMVVTVSRPAIERKYKKRSHFRLCCVYALDLIYREINRSVAAWSVDCIDEANVAAIQYELRPMDVCWCVCGVRFFFISINAHKRSSHWNRIESKISRLSQQCGDWLVG